MNRPFKNALADAADFFVAAGQRETIWRAWVVALVAMVLTYRLELGAAIYFQATQVARLQPAAVPVGKFVQAALNDFLFVGLLGLGHLGLKILAVRLWPRLAVNIIIKSGEGLLVVVLLLLMAFTERTHYQLLLQLDTGLTLDFVKTTPELVTADDFFQMLTWPDVAFILTPVFVFVLAWLFARTWQRLDKYVFVVLLGFVLCAQMAGPQTLPPVIASQTQSFTFRRTPWRTMTRELFGKKTIITRACEDLPGAEQTNSIQLVDEAFVNPQPQPPAPRHEPASTADGKPWNILFFVLESSGADYVFDTSAGNPTPMPFLQKMTREGLYLDNHFTSANNTAKAAFSLFTGLYPSTGRKIFAMEKNVVIPTLNRYLPAEYDYFLIHPTEPEFSFPPALFLNNGLHDFYNQENMPPDRRPAPNGLARNEIDSFDFLITRLDTAREPFLGIYWSFIPHYPLCRLWAGVSDFARRHPAAGLLQ